jgi:hypothetical protein
MRRARSRARSREQGEEQGKVIAILRIADTNKYDQKPQIESKLLRHNLFLFNYISY